MSGKDKGIFGKLVDTFAPEVEDEAPAQAAALPPVLPGTAAPATPQGPAPAADPAFLKQLDEGAAGQMSAAVGKVAGSYAELMTNMEVLAEAVPDEAARMRAAMKLLGKKGIAAAKVLSDVDACLGALDEENRTFKAATQDQIDQKVGSKRKSLEQLRADMSAKQQQISALQDDIAALAARQAATAAEIKSDEGNITLVQDRFSYVFTNMRASLTAQRARIAAQGS